ncbi:MAG: CoA pyrophosphatase [Gemmatimonadaceae bacterium]
MIPLALSSHAQIRRLAISLKVRHAPAITHPGAKRACVALLIRLGAVATPEILLIQRAEYEGDPWSGQIAFPGGREEPGDESLYDTAARETFEETGIDLRANGELLGTLDDLHPLTVRLPAVIVRPFVVLVADITEVRHNREVAKSFWVPFPKLSDRAVWRETTVAAGGHEFSRLAFHHEGCVVWGMTERILSGLIAGMARV